MFPGPQGLPMCPNRPSARRAARLCLEALESREMPAVVTTANESHDANPDAKDFVGPVAGRAAMMAGVATASCTPAIEPAHEAETLGAAAVQLLAPLRPFAGAPTRDDLVAYLEAVSRETHLPITLYLNPGPGADVSIADTIALARLPRVHFIKESS